MTDETTCVHEFAPYEDGEDECVRCGKPAAQIIAELHAALAAATRRAEEAEQEGISDKPCGVTDRPDGSRFCAAHQEPFIPTCSRGLASYGRRMREQRDALAEALRDGLESHGCRRHGVGCCCVVECWQDRARAALATVPADDRAKEVMPNQDVHGLSEGARPVRCVSSDDSTSPGVSVSAPGELDFVKALKIARERYERHPFWKRLDGTPWANDAPVIAAELMMTMKPESDRARLTREVVEAARQVSRFITFVTFAAGRPRYVLGAHPKAHEAAARLKEALKAYDAQEESG